MNNKQNRNDKCNCNSGKKYKHCCYSNDQESYKNAIQDVKQQIANSIAKVEQGSNQQVFDMLNDSSNYGFYKMFELKASRNVTYSIYQTIYNINDCPEAKQYLNKMDSESGEELFENHMSVYQMAFGALEAAVYNTVRDFESYSLNYYKNEMGNIPYKAFDGVTYRVNMLVVQSGKKITGIHPLFDHSWEKKSYEFTTAYDGKKKLPHLLSLVARNVMGSIITSDFNPGAEQSIINLLRGYGMGMTAITERVMSNWKNTYNACYHFSRDLMGSNKTFDTHTKQDLSNLWSILD